ncbi:hypothetical protein AB0J72_23550 [Dactylosporangium sp. NPDC049742]
MTTPTRTAATRLRSALAAAGVDTHIEALPAAAARDPAVQITDDGGGS